MSTASIAIIVLVVTASLALVAFLIWKNQQDKKTFNPDAENSIEETITDKERRRDKI